MVTFCYVCVVYHSADIVSFFRTHAELTVYLILRMILFAAHRAPEVTLGLPVSEAIDMWSLGCVLVLLYIVHNPFSKYCEYQSVSNQIYIVLVLNGVFI